jgi:hypothetical protein
LTRRDGSGDSCSVTVRYRALFHDNSRWEGFELRSTDIIISTPPKCGTTWTQMLCALLIFDGPDFPAPLNELSPWLDQTLQPLEEVRSRLAAQQHRRFIKTHTPLDGLPWRDDVTYVVVGRDPRDAMVSMKHHLENLDMERVLALRERAVGNDDLDALPERPTFSGNPREDFLSFISRTDRSGPVNLTAILHDLELAWQQRHRPNVVMCHYADYLTDLPGEVRRLGRALGIEPSPARSAELAAEASLERMQSRTSSVVPNAHQIWKDDDAFLRAAGTGEWRTYVTEADLTDYHRAVARLVPPELARWVHEGRLAAGIDPEHTP